MSRKVNLSGQEVVTAKQHNEALAHAKNLIKEQANRIAELEREHDEKDRNFDKMRELANLKGYQAALDAVLELPIWNSLLLEVPAVIVNDAKREVEKLREATDEGE